MEEREYTSDFEIGNATYEEILRKEAVEALKDAHVSEFQSMNFRQLIDILEEEDPELAETLKNTGGMGKDNLWTVRIDKLAEDYKENKDFMIRHSPESLQNMKLYGRLALVVDRKRKLGQPYEKEYSDAKKIRQKLDDLLNANYEPTDIFTKYINKIVVEEVSHALGYRHKENKSNILRDHIFFFRFVNFDTSRMITIDIEDK